MRGHTVYTYFHLKVYKKSSKNSDIWFLLDFLYTFIFLIDKVSVMCYNGIQCLTQGNFKF